jgi:histidinol phosphatase-like enzyme (inositol monophosphatase family)
MKLKNKHLEKYLEFAVKTVKKSEEITFKYYKKKLKHKLKVNKTPVTTADFKCEDFIINKIKAKYPKHSILSEERGELTNGSEFKWIIDPIDGTKNFMREFPFWGTLLALEYEGEVVLGVISMPAVNDLIYASKGNGCYYNSKKAKASRIDSLKNSYCIYGGLDYILRQSYGKNFLKLVGKCSYSRGFGDCHGYSFVINGRAEMMIDPHVAPYDVAPVKICVEEAGGVFTDINGNKSIYGGNAVATNGILHDEVLKLLNHSTESGNSMKLNTN